MKQTSIKVVRELAKLNLNSNQMLLVCSSCGNPDFGQYSSQSPNTYYIVDSFEEASAYSRLYIEHHMLGGGNWSGGQVYSGAGHHIATVSYNGRVWKAGKDFVNRAEIEIDSTSVEKFHNHLTV